MILLEVITMRINDWIRARRAIRRTARLAGVTPAQCRRDMAAAIEAAWASQDPDARETQIQRFPAGKPTVEQFILTLSRELG